MSDTIPRAMIDDKGKTVQELVAELHGYKIELRSAKRLITRLEKELAAWKTAGQRLGLKEATVCLGCGKEHCDCPCGTATKIYVPRDKDWSPDLGC